MKKCLIWGCSLTYNNFRNLLMYEVLKKNIEIIAFVDKKPLCNKKEGLNIIKKESIKDFHYDYIITFSNNKHKEIVEDAKSVGIDENKLIDGSIFAKYNFDFKRYISLIENPVTIISDDCFGAFTYKYLNLKYTSPLISTKIMEDDYLKFLENFENYISSELYLERPCDLDNNESLIASIRYKNEKVLLHYWHDINFEECQSKWEIRKQRINLENLLFKITIRDPKNIERFENLPFKNKIAFYHSNLNSKNIFVPKLYKKRFEDGLFMKFGYHEYIFDPKFMKREIDYFKLLNHEKDFALLE